MEGVGRVAWSLQGDRLAYDKVDVEGRYHLYTANPQTLTEECLTCLPYDLKKRNSLNPVWHPSGDYIFFQVQSHPRRLRLSPVEMATPERGLWSEIYVIRRDGKDFWQLSRVAEDGGAAIDPQVSHEGNLLMWSERIRSRAGRWGSWVLRVGEINQTRGIVRIDDVREYEPGRQKLFLGASTFTPDDRGALVFGNREAGQNETGMDVYRFEFESGRLERLTHNQRSWDEQARYSPRGDKIVWASASEIPLRKPEETGEVPFEQLRDLWMMNVDGTAKERLTYFNHPDAPESLGAAIVDDFAWNPRGDEIIAHVVWNGRAGLTEGIYLVKLDASFQR